MLLNFLSSFLLQVQSDQVGIFKNGVIYSSFVHESKIVAYYRNGVVYRVDRYGAQQPIAKYDGVDYTGIMAAITTGLIPE